MRTSNNELELFNIPKIHQNFDATNKITLHLGDSSDFFRKMPSGAATLIITSPPYNIGKIYEDRKHLHEYLADQETVIDELVRILADDGSICWEVGNHVDNGEIYPLDIFFYQIFKNKGLILKNRIIWHFGHGLHCSKRFSGRYETILWFAKTEKYKFNLDNVRIPSKYPGKRNYKEGPNKGKPSCNPLGKNPSDVWEIIKTDWNNELWDIPNVKSNHPEKTEHPCQFPIELVERCILALTDENDLVVDPYCGVGSALIAGIKNLRRVAGCDRDQGYIETAKKRIYDFYSGKLKIRQIGKEIYKPTGKEKVSQIPEEWKNNEGNLL
jgi:DNA modification methylase